MIQLIPDDFIDYLTENGYRVCPNGILNRIELSGGGIGISIDRCRASFWQFFDGGEDDQPDFICIGEVTGLDKIDLLGWQFILHTYGIVKIQDFKRRAESARESLSETNLFNQLGAIVRPVKHPY